MTTVWYNADEAWKPSKKSLHPAEIPLGFPGKTSPTLKKSKTQKRVVFVFCWSLTQLPGLTVRLSSEKTHQQGNQSVVSK